MKRIVAIHDLAGLGRVSLNVVIPVLSALHTQVCPLPTAILSSSTTGFSNFHFLDLTASMRATLEHWESFALQVDAVYSGFLGSPDQVDLVARCADTCLSKGGMLVVDPVMGDNGILEPTMDNVMVERMRWLVSRATCITPNLTEASLLLGETYPEALLGQGMPIAMVREWLHRLAAMGPEMAVITSIPVSATPSAVPCIPPSAAPNTVPSTALGATQDAAPGTVATPRDGCEHTTMMVAAYIKSEDSYWAVPYTPFPMEYPGTGDTFTSILTGLVLQGVPLPEAMDRAVQGILVAMKATMQAQTPPREGLWIETALQLIQKPLAHNSFIQLSA